MSGKKATTYKNVARALEPSTAGFIGFSAFDDSSAADTAAYTPSTDVSGVNLSGKAAKDVGSEPFYTGDDADFATALRKLHKKDVTTKLKGCEDMINIIKTREKPRLKEFIPVWSYVYGQLTFHNDRRVRVAAQTILHAFAAAGMRKSFAPVLDRLLPFLLISTRDMVKEVANAGTAAAVELFGSEEKLTEALHMYAEAVLATLNSYIVKSATELSDMKITTAEEADERMARVQACTLEAFGFLLRLVLPEAASGSELQQGVFKTLQDKLVWKLADSDAPFVRKAVYKLLKTAVETFPQLLCVPGTLLQLRPALTKIAFGATFGDVAANQYIAWETISTVASKLPATFGVVTGDNDEHVARCRKVGPAVVANDVNPTVDVPQYLHSKLISSLRCGCMGQMVAVSGFVVELTAALPTRVLTNAGNAKAAESGAKLSKTLCYQILRSIVESLSATGENYISPVLYPQACRLIFDLCLVLLSRVSRLDDRAPHDCIVGTIEQIISLSIGGSSSGDMQYTALHGLTADQLAPLAGDPFTMAVASEVGPFIRTLAGIRDKRGELAEEAEHLSRINAAVERISYALRSGITTRVSSVIEPISSSPVPAVFVSLENAPGFAEVLTQATDTLLGIVCREEASDERPLEQAAALLHTLCPQIAKARGVAHHAIPGMLAAVRHTVNRWCTRRSAGSWRAAQDLLQLAACPFAESETAPGFADELFDAAMQTAAYIDATECIRARFDIFGALLKVSAGKYCFWGSQFSELVRSCLGECFSGRQTASASKDMAGSLLASGYISGADVVNTAISVIESCLSSRDLRPLHVALDLLSATKSSVGFAFGDVHMHSILQTYDHVLDTSTHANVDAFCDAILPLLDDEQKQGLYRHAADQLLALGSVKDIADLERRLASCMHISASLSNTDGFLTEACDLLFAPFRSLDELWQRAGILQVCDVLLRSPGWQQLASNNFAKHLGLLPNWNADMSVALGFFSLCLALSRFPSLSRTARLEIIELFNDASSTCLLSHVPLLCTSDTDHNNAHADGEIFFAMWKQADMLFPLGNMLGGVMNACASLSSSCVEPIPSFVLHIIASRQLTVLSALCSKEGEAVDKLPELLASAAADAHGSSWIPANTRAVPQAIRAEVDALAHQSAGCTMTPPSDMMLRACRIYALAKWSVNDICSCGHIAEGCCEYILGKVGTAARECGYSPTFSAAALPVAAAGFLLAQSSAHAKLLHPLRKLSWMLATSILNAGLQGGCASAAEWVQGVAVLPIMSRMIEIDMGVTDGASVSFKDGEDSAWPPMPPIHFAIFSLLLAGRLNAATSVDPAYREHLVRQAVWSATLCNLRNSTSEASVGETAFQTLQKTFRQLITSFTSEAFSNDQVCILELPALVESCTVITPHGEDATCPRHISSANITALDSLYSSQDADETAPPAVAEATPVKSNLAATPSITSNLASAGRSILSWFGYQETPSTASTAVSVAPASSAEDIAEPESLFLSADCFPAKMAVLAESMASLAEHLPSTSATALADEIASLPSALRVTLECEPLYSSLISASHALTNEEAAGIGEQVYLDSIRLASAWMVALTYLRNAGGGQSFSISEYLLAPRSLERPVDAALFLSSCLFSCVHASTQNACLQAQLLDITKCCVVYFAATSPHTFASVVAAMPRSAQLEIEEYVTRHISPLLFAAATRELTPGSSRSFSPVLQLSGDFLGRSPPILKLMEAVRAVKPVSADVVTALKDLDITMSASMGEILVKYAREDLETTLQIRVTLPGAYPIRRPVINCEQRRGVSEEKWKLRELHMLNLLTTQECSIAEAVASWKMNIDKEFEGMEPCPICFSVLHISTRRVPKADCPTCHNKFHNECLYKWFNSSNESKCPMCRQQFR